MSNDELVDVLDTEGRVLGTIPRTQAELDNHITPNVLVFLFNSAGKVWAQLRPRSKKHYPGKWDISACGGVVNDETPEEAAQRETVEETGLEVTLHHVESFLNVFPGDQGEARKRFSHLYVGLSDKVPQPGEDVEEFKEWCLAELREDINARPEAYVPSFLIELEKAVCGFRGLMG